jgi:hypothetical protein
VSIFDWSALAALMAGMDAVVANLTSAIAPLTRARRASEAGQRPGTHRRLSPVVDAAIAAEVQRVLPESGCASAP